MKTWAERRRKSKLSSTITEFGGCSSSEEDEDLEVDFDKTFRLETKVGTLNEKTKCFLKLKLEMLHDEESDNRLLRNNSPKRYAKKAEGRRDNFIIKDGKAWINSQKTTEKKYYGNNKPISDEKLSSRLQ